MAADLSKVIAGLECCADLDRSCDECGYRGAEYCEVALMKDALELLRSIPRTCEECAHSNSLPGEEPCESCAAKYDEEPTHWRWKHGND